MPTELIVLLTTAFVAAMLATRYALGWLRKAALDMPNARSSHTVPTPRGGGIGFVPVLLAGWGVLAVTGRPWDLLVILAVGGIAAVGFLDDRLNLRRRVRFGLQILAVAAVVTALPDGLVFQGVLPFLVDRLAAGFLLLWFVNLYNFMDGIDGLAGAEAVSIGCGIALLAVAGVAPALPAAQALVLGAAVLGFLVFNWHPAKLFMGDVGSLALGLALGFLLLTVAASGYLAAALILPMYFVADASLTVGRRLLRRERIWDAHRQHAYQRAVDSGLSHAQVTLLVIGLNIVLCGLALGALFQPMLCFVAACVLTLTFVAVLPGLKERVASNRRRR